MGVLLHLQEVRRDSPTPTRLQVYASLRTAIVRGDLGPGTQLSENALASELGVSRTPIREALGRLRDDRLLDVVPQLGTFVSQISPQAVRDAQFIRESLECAAVRLAAELVTDDDLPHLEEILQAQDRADASGDEDAFYLLDDAFHRELINLSGHASASAVSDRAKAHLNRIRRLSLGMPDYLAEMIREHRAVVAALAERDAEGAEAALRHHLRMVLREVPALRERHPEYFED